MGRVDNGSFASMQRETEPQDDNSQPGPIILAVGNVQHWIGAGRALPMDSQIAFAEFHEISETLLHALTPDIVMSPVLSRGFDCLDLAQMLVQCGFRGRLRVVAPRMPHPDLIQSEIRALCPKLDVSFIYYDNTATRRIH